MTTSIRSQHLNLTEGMDDFIRDKVEKLHHYLPNIDTIDVEISKQNRSKGPDWVIVQITVRHSRGAILRAEEKTEYADHSTIKAAVNLATDKMYRRIRRFKGKKRSKRMREAYSVSQDELLQAEALPIDTLDAQQSNTEIVRRKDVHLMPMSEEEAIEQMELLGHNFFMFFNMDQNTTNVIYRRSNGGYGLLQPILD